ncbi:hypothetical protein MPTK1_1g18520 [Marchantia polymorpha subsp. ruderalis]|uniref:J domain-containing protein n=2 Tax=Marchantia polymorpha TaxID=3197 RepID=A0A176WPN6_MARPO|nr:hypothetical protein AXG93_167s1020 [Marchantia polymorpha subsp. ruderalis]PTQ50155.1 hypothetical protein MARPO_0001s0190 [Marchantia polymorpha]BBM99078.1 hypothetical protein Mp_1g18520 [Marchantia polymorpha subsp. ruderalis]|eukprot:PTQ50155.1 hypothetical protein MARPO_0001s0190 [Marchantia polymorpha]
MEDREDMEARRKQGNSEPPDASSGRFLARWGSLLVTALISASLVANVLSLRRRVMNFRSVASQEYSTRYGSSERPGAKTQQTRRAQQQRRPEVYEVNPEDVKRFWEQHLREMERIRRVQQAFENERRRYRKDYDYDPWHETQGRTQTWEWRWEGNRWVWQRHHEQRWNEGDRRWEDEGSQWYRNQTDPHPALKSSRQHYKVLGLDPSRTPPYSDAEIKAAFRAKALEFHPDRNQTNKEEAEEKFRQVMDAYNALRSKTN